MKVNFFCVKSVINVNVLVITDGRFTGPDIMRRKNKELLKETQHAFIILTYKMQLDPMSKTEFDSRYMKHVKHVTGAEEKRIVLYSSIEDLWSAFVNDGVGKRVIIPTYRQRNTIPVATMPTILSTKPSSTTRETDPPTAVTIQDKTSSPANEIGKIATTQVETSTTAKSFFTELTKNESLSAATLRTKLIDLEKPLDDGRSLVLIVSIVVGVLLALLILVGNIVLVINKRRRKEVKHRTVSKTPKRHPKYSMYRKSSVSRNYETGGSSHPRGGSTAATHYDRFSKARTQSYPNAKPTKKKN